MAGPGLPTNITPGTTGRIAHTNTVHGYINKLDASIGSAAAGQVLAWNGTAYAPSNTAPVFYPTGAVFDGTTDNRAAIQAACNAAAAAGGGTVVLPAGTGIVTNGGSGSSGCISLSNNVTLQGQGVGVTILKLAATQNAGDVTGVVRTPSSVQNHNVTIRDLTIDGNKAQNLGAGRTIGFYCGVSPNSTQTDIDIRCINVEIQNCTDYGFDPHERTTRLALIDCLAHDNVGDGFALDAQYDLIMSNCYAYNNGRHGFNFVTASADCTLDNCHAYGNASNGLTIQQGSKRITVSGGKFHNNTLDGIVINGVAMTGSQQDLTPGWRNKVYGTFVNNNGAHGIHLVGSSYNSIDGNTVLDNSQTATNASSGIYLDESGADFSTYNRVRDNTVASSGTPAHKYGIREKTSSNDNNFILGNSVTGAATTNLSLLGTQSLALAAHNGINEHPTTANPYVTDSPAAHGFKEWNFDPIVAGASAGTNGNTQVMNFARLTTNSAGPFNNVVVVVGTLGSSLSNGYAGVYDSAGTLLAQSAETSTTFTTTGVKTIALTSAISNQPAGSTLFVAVLCTSSGTMPSFVRSSSTGASTPNAGLGASFTNPYRFGTFGTALTALPGTFAMTSASSSSLSFWTALS